MLFLRSSHGLPKNVEDGGKVGTHGCAGEMSVEALAREVEGGCSCAKEKLAVSG